MPAIASLEDLKAAQKPLRYALMRSALCFREMAQNRLEKHLQPLASITDTGAIEGGGKVRNCQTVTELIIVK